MDADADECVFKWVAKNTIGVAVGVPLIVKNQSDQNIITYLTRNWVCWLLMDKRFPDHSNLIFSCDQAALRTIISVYPSVTPFWQCFWHRIILKISGVITMDRCDVHAKGQGQRSKVKVTEVMTPLNRFRTVTPVWIHIWRWSDVAQKRCSIVFQGHTTKKIADFDPN